MFHIVTEPKFVCPTFSKTNQWDIKYATRRRFNREASKQGDSRQAHICLSQLRLEQVFIIMGTRITYIVMKRLGKHDYSWGKREHVHWANICNTHSMFSLGWSLNIKMRQNSTLEVKRSSVGQGKGLYTWSESQYKLDVVLGSLSGVRNAGSCLFIV